MDIIIEEKIMNRFEEIAKENNKNSEELLSEIIEKVVI